MPKHLIDSDLYIDLIRTGRYLPEIDLLYERETPNIFFSSVVAEELLAGARYTSMVKIVTGLVRPFEKVNRILTPSHKDWKAAGTIVAKILATHPWSKEKLSSLENDCLLAASARSNGAFVHTKNRSDFLLIQSVFPFSLIVLS
jgi:predicted nucleic acid-binding protein